MREWLTCEVILVCFSTLYLHFQYLPIVINKVIHRHMLLLAAAVHQAYEAVFVQSIAAQLVSEPNQYRAT